MPDLVARSVWQEGLREAVTEVLEKMFFIRILDGPCLEAAAGHEAEGRSSSAIAARVAFHGEPSGRLSLDLDGGAARSIAGDFLGEEETELEQRQVEDVVCELANMICGAMLSRVESTVIFRLDSPVIVSPTDSGAGSPETAMHAFPIGKGDFTAKIWMEAPVCGSTEKSAF